MTSVPDLPSPFRVVFHDTIDSTMAEARRIAEATQPKWAMGPSSTLGEIDVIWAGEQTAGRGRRGRTWVSNPGNLYCSLLLRPELSLEKTMQLGFVAANATCETIAALLPKGSMVNCKWPNDVLIEGRKAAGILLETSSLSEGAAEWVIIGLGVNIAAHPDETEFPATSLSHEGVVYDGSGGAIEDIFRDVAARFLESFCLRFLAGFVTFRNLGFAPVRQAWLRRAYGLGRPVTVRLEHACLDGTFKELDEDGALVLETGDGKTQRISAGDVFMAATGNAGQ